jgi:hypothetical protein
VIRDPALLYPLGILTINEVRAANSLPPVEALSPGVLPEQRRIKGDRLPVFYQPIWWDALGLLIGAAAMVAAFLVWRIW